MQSEPPARMTRRFTYVLPFFPYTKKIALALFLLVPFLATVLCVASSPPTSFDEQFRLIIKKVDDAELYRFFNEMPKGGILHLHSEYAVPPEFWLKIATAGGKENEYFTNVREPSCRNTGAKR